ncbi:MAG: RNA polymerase sigma factor [Ignavibacteria bacterium]|nr:RNA polymerase sigma factor [Ignavibacteria bacterium]
MPSENTTYINYLIEISKTGRQRGFLDLCDIILPNVYTVVFRLVNDTDLAKRITSKTLVDAWGEMKDFDIRQPFVNWIKNAAVLHSIDELAKNPALFQTSIEKSIKNPEAKDLESLIKSLPPLSRIIFVLHDLEGYSYTEIVKFFPEFIEDELKTNLIQTRQYLIGSIAQ